MKIETKFNIGDNVYTILDNNIVCHPVTSIQYMSGEVAYTLLIRESETLMDKNKYATFSESSCFKSIDDLADYYKAKFIKS